MPLNHTRHTICHPKKGASLHGQNAAAPLLGGFRLPPPPHNELNKNIASNPTNNINITVNVANGQAVGETSQDSSQSAQDENQQKNQEAKSLAALIKNQVIEVITQQQRPGGILRR